MENRTEPTDENGRRNPEPTGVRDPLSGIRVAPVAGLVCLVFALVFFLPAAASGFVGLSSPWSIDPNLEYYQAVNLAMSGDEAGASIVLENFLLLRPESTLADEAGFLLGVCYYRMGQPGRARLMLEKALERFPLVGDYCLHYLYQIDMDLGRYDSALTMINAILASYPKSVLAGELEQDLARIYFRAGKYQRCYLEIQRALIENRNPPGKDELLLLAARSLEELGDQVRAAEIYGRIWREEKVGPAAYTAWERFNALFFSDRESLTSPLWADQAQAWGSRLQNAGKYGKALEVNSKLLEFMDRNLYPTDKIHDLRLKLVNSLFRVRRYEQCITEADALLAQDAFGDRSAALYWKARALSRMGEIDEAAAIFKTLSTGPPEKELTEDSAYQLALLYVELGRYGDALTEFRRLKKEFPARRYLRRATWYEAWCLLRENNYSVAAKGFEHMTATTAGLKKWKYRYWTARALHRGGHRKKAVEIMREIYKARPLDYYGLAAYRFLAVLGVRVDPPAAHIDETGDGPRKRFPALDPSAHLDATTLQNLVRAYELLHLGLAEEAVSELVLVEKKASDSRLLAELARIYASVGTVRRAERLARDRLSSFLLDSDAPRAYDYWRFAYPKGYANAVAGNARDFGVPEELVFAVAHEESTFRPEAVSPVGAMGLMQIMPKTGEWIAGQVGVRDFADQDLMNPEVNVLFGTWYLRFLLDRYDGRLAKAVAAYNAGEKAVDRWTRHKPDDDPTEYFIEEIPYQETRDYVKKVTRSLTLYQLIYGADRQ